MSPFSLLAKFRKPKVAVVPTPIWAVYGFHTTQPARERRIPWVICDHDGVAALAYARREQSHGWTVTRVAQVGMTQPDKDGVYSLSVDVPVPQAKAQP